MTRFARAKGSKSSNEKKPEEATSWSEMRNSMLAKKLTKPEEKASREEAPVKTESPKKAEWASLGGDTLTESISLIKRHMNRQNSSGEIKKEKKIKKANAEGITPSMTDASKVEKKKKKKKKSLAAGATDTNSTPVVSDAANVEKKKKKRPKGLPSDNVEPKKKGKKRKSTEGDVTSEAVLPKKKKKLIKNDVTEPSTQDSSVQERVEKKNKNTENRSSQKNRNQKVKSKEFKKENDVKKGFKPPKGKPFEGKKKFKNKNFKEKPPQAEDIIINGEKVPIIKFQGFYVTVEDAERLKKLRAEMKKEGIPKAKLEAAIKLERRRAEKALSRLKKAVCFHCRGHGHLLSNCPNLLEKENTGTGICYKCGSTEHSATECKVVRGTNYQFAECFICKEQGHIARQCPDNPRGLYPQGGACRECGDVTHLRKDCPKVQAQKADEVVTVGVRRDRDLECLDEEIASREKQETKKVKKSSTVKF